MFARNVVQATFVVLLFIAGASGSSAQGFKTLISFNGVNGRYPFVPPVQGTDGNLYGTTVYGGAYDRGSIYKITLAGQLSTVYSFCSLPGCPDGEDLYGGLLLAADGNFYGVTMFGGTNNEGTVFKLTSGGQLTTLYNFCSMPGCTDGWAPETTLIQATDGNLYGTTGQGGAYGGGTVFKITTAGRRTTLYDFCTQSGCADGSFPNQLVQGKDRSFYGTTYYGGTDGYGTIFKLTPKGQLTTLHSFCSDTLCTDGSHPSTALVQSSDGAFYGTTDFGGSLQSGGTVFSITSTGQFATVYDFCVTTGCPDGYWPLTPLVQASNGMFYGTTSRGGGGSMNGGTIFSLNSAGQLTTLYSFCPQSGCADGQTPVQGMLQATSGAFYGTASAGGSANDGTAFSFSAGLRPFIVTNPAAGKVGSSVMILGNNLSGTTSVTFNGVAAIFTVASATEITTTVPSGATTGKVKVTTSTRTLTTNVAFRVLP